MTEQQLARALAVPDPAVREYCIRNAKRLLQESDAEKFLRSHGLEIAGSSVQREPGYRMLTFLATSPEEERDLEPGDQRCIVKPDRSLVLLQWYRKGGVLRVEWEAWVAIEPQAPRGETQSYLSVATGELETYIDH